MLLLATSSAMAEELSRYEAARPAMGSRFSIVLYAENDDQARTAFGAAFRRIADLDQALNDYDPRSELSKLSAASPTQSPVTASDDLWAVMLHSRRFHGESGGAFDVTVGPLTSLWREARRKKTLPTVKQREAALAAVGFQHVAMIEASQSISLARANMRIDLGGIAKGFAVDEALAALKKHGIESALVNGGGDIAASAAPPLREGWKIGVAPLAADAKPSRFLLIAHQAIATSGDTWQFVEIDGVRYSHIVDPQTGLGLTERSSVTVVAPDCTTADALASAISVLGLTKGVALVERMEGASALVIREVDGKVVQRESKRFEELRQEDK